MVDLTSDFFKPPTKNPTKSLVRRLGGGQTAPREKRLIINNPRQNAVMVDLGKCRIRQLMNYQGQMMATNNLKEFKEMFAPFDENYASELAEKMLA
jgi:hypothetical protein